MTDRRAAWRHVRLATKQTLGQSVCGPKGRLSRGGAGEAAEGGAGGRADGAGGRPVSVGVPTADGIAEIVIDFPPVNVLPV